MPDVTDFFRFCPSCGRRFHIKLVSKTLVGDRKEVRQVKQMLVGPPTNAFRSPYVVVVQDTIPVTVDVQDFEYAYRCKHCGHVWTEEHSSESTA